MRRPSKQSSAAVIRALSMLVLSTFLLVLPAGCSTGKGSTEQVTLVITPVATPTATPPAQPTAAPVTYVVKPGDTLSGIADLFGVSVDDIVRVNDIADPNSLQVGQVLIIPGRAPTNTPAPSTTGTPAPSNTGATQTPTPASSNLPPPDVTPPLGPTEAP